MKRLVVDLDDTISSKTTDDYADALPNRPLIKKLKRYQESGFEIVINTARNMRTYEGNIGKINAHTLPVIIDWLTMHDVPFDEIYTGKPWCGTEGFYIDDKAIRPAEFVDLSPEQIQAILLREKFIPNT